MSWMQQLKYKTHECNHACDGFAIALRVHDDDRDGQLARISFY